MAAAVPTIVHVKCSVCLANIENSEPFDKCGHNFCDSCLGNFSQSVEGKQKVCQICEIEKDREQLQKYNAKLRVRRNSEFQRCIRHNRIQDVYCMEHRIIVCNMCATIKHSPATCTCITVERARKSELMAMKNLSNLRTEMLTHMGNVSKELDDTEAKIKDAVKSVNKRLDYIQEKIETFYKRSTQEIRQHREDTKTTLHHLKTTNKRTKRIITLSKTALPEPEVKGKWELGMLVTACEKLRKDCVRMQRELTRISINKIVTSMNFKEQEGLARLLVSNYWSVGQLALEHGVPAHTKNTRRFDALSLI